MFREKIGEENMAKCSECGKEFFGFYDWEHYVYRKNNKIYCCWTCYRNAIKRQKENLMFNKKGVNNE